VTKRGLVVPVQDLARNKGRICLVSDIGADRKTTLLRFGFGLWFWFFWLEGQRHFALPRQGQTKLQVVDLRSVLIFFHRAPSAGSQNQIVIDGQIQLEPLIK